MFIHMRRSPYHLRDTTLKGPPPLYKDRLSFQVVSISSYKRLHCVIPNRGLKQHQYVARYPFHGQESGQLSFAAGHVIECEGESDDNWQFGTNLQVSVYLHLHTHSSSTAHHFITLCYHLHTVPPSFHHCQTGRSGWFPVNFLDVHHHHSQGEVPKTAASAGAVALPPVDYGTMSTIRACISDHR